jgi:phosphoribosylpyrophosphate synthetase
MNLSEQPFENALKLVMRANTIPLTYTRENDVYIVKQRIVTENKPAPIPELSTNKPNSISSMELIGSVRGKDVIIIDDCADTCGTLNKATDLLIEQGALNVYCIATHPVLSGKAFFNLSTTNIHQLIVSDTIGTKIPLGFNALIKQVSCVPVLEKVIKNLIYDESISQLNEL